MVIECHQTISKSCLYGEVKFFYTFYSYKKQILRCWRKMEMGESKDQFWVYYDPILSLLEYWLWYSNSFPHLKSNRVNIRNSRWYLLDGITVFSLFSFFVHHFHLHALYSNVFTCDGNTPPEVISRNKVSLLKIYT